MVLPVLVGITLLDSVKRLKQLARVIHLGVGYLAFEFNVSYLEGYNRIREEGFGGLDNNGVAILLDSGVGLSIVLALGAKTWWSKSINTGIVLLLIHGVLLSNSRGGIVALLVTGIVSFLLLPKRALHYVLFGLILLIGVRLAGEEVRGRFITLLDREGVGDASLEARKNLLTYALDSLGKRPLMGVGPNHWNRTVRSEYGIPDGMATEVHNTWLQVAAELGLPGAALILTYYGLCVVRLLPLARSLPGEADPEAADLTRMVISSVIGSVVACSFVSVESVEAPYYITLLDAGMSRPASSPCPLPRPTSSAGDIPESERPGRR
jgi:O-antigen ligase